MLAQLTTTYKQSPWLKAAISDWNAILEKLNLKPFFVSKGTIVYHQGSSTGSIFVVKSGRVNMSIVGIEGEEKCLFVLSSGCVFGEVVLLGTRIVGMQATAVTPVELYEIPGESIYKMLESDIRLNRIIIQSLIQKTLLLTSHVELLSFYDSSYRIIEVLTYLMEQFGKADNKGGIFIEMKFTHQELANLVGVSRVTVTNFLNRMKREGLIMKRKTGIYVTDPGRLKVMQYTI